MSEIRHFCKGRTFYVADNGACGIAPLAAKQGDIVTVLLGCNAPMILRPYTNGSYKLIGEAYCDNFMNGEALLGPMPDDFEVIWRFEDGADGAVLRSAYLNKKTGKFQLEDPRSGPLPPGWEIRSHAEDQYWQLFANDEIGQETRFDPRLTSEELRKRGVPVQLFELA